MKPVKHWHYQTAGVLVAKQTLNMAIQALIIDFVMRRTESHPGQPCPRRATDTKRIPDAREPLVAASRLLMTPQRALSSPPKLIGRQDQTSAAPDRCLGAAGEVHKVPSYARAGPTAIWTAEMHSNNTWNRSHLSHLQYNHKMMLFRSVAKLFL